MHNDRGGPTVKPETVQREISRTMNRNAGALAEKVLAKALSGDSTAQLAAVQLLSIGMGQPDK